MSILCPAAAILHLSPDLNGHVLLRLCLAGGLGLEYLALCGIIGEKLAIFYHQSSRFQGIDPYQAPIDSGLF